MRIIIIILSIISLVCLVSCKSNGKTISDTTGQEVIEIGRLKEFPPGVEEEPSVDLDEEELDGKSSISGSLMTSKKDGKRTTPSLDARKKLKDVEKIDGVSPEDEEMKLEKELAEIYKDTDYKDSAEETNEPKETTSSIRIEPTTEEVDTAEVEKPIGRQRNSFKFAPDSTNKKDIEKFRTSVDDINCKNKQKLSYTKTPASAGIKMGSNIINVVSVLFISVLYN